MEEIEYDLEYEIIEDLGKLSETDSIYELDIKEIEEPEYEQIYMTQEIIDIVETTLDSEEGTSQTVMFDEERYGAIKEKQISLRDKDVFIRPMLPWFNKTIYIAKYDEVPINIENVKGNTTIPLITREWVNSELANIKRSTRERLKNIVIGGIQIMIKGYFREGMDIPIQIYLMDNRILHDPMDALLGVIFGNLVYKKIIFTIRPEFAMSILDENLSLGLNLYHKIDILCMPPRSKAVTLHYKALYAFTTTHQKEINKISREFIEIHEYFKNLAQFTSLRMLSDYNISLAQEILLDFHQRSRRIDSNLGNQGLATLNTFGQFVVRMPSRRIERSISTRELSSSSRPSTSRNYPTIPRNSIDIDLKKNYCMIRFHAILDTGSGICLCNRGECYTEINQKQRIPVLRINELEEELENIKIELKECYHEHPLAKWDKDKPMATIELKNPDVKISEKQFPYSEEDKKEFEIQIKEL
ncbi:uncharacterized protein LOC111406501 [Olea europaea var. sylvestris]|uniref:uncharacterized protein LOC111406501 n=1 Tax=Olea europaea var. sylvestris TaxID=158386 RepID=UPI000C1D174C|nr:uncharacterized protein LOC111406501 [Olea europaea var. sylvestris]